MEYLLLFVLIYFIPTFVAWSKKKKNAGAIATVNLLLGWTFFGWVIALVWAMMVEKNDTN